MNALVVNGIQYSIQAVARQTGLTPHVIRAWERRYQAVEPQRTATNRRYYSEREIERLTLLREAIEKGHRIGNLAGLPLEQLRKLRTQDLDAPKDVGQSASDLRVVATGRVTECLDAIAQMNSQALNRSLERASTEFGNQGMLQKVLSPVANQVGNLWMTGEMSAAHEHFATGAITAFLNTTSRPFAAIENAPGLVVATPAGQLHGLGALMVQAAAANLGWRVAYLGTSLPAAEISLAVRQKSAAVLALSLVYPANDPRLADELMAIRQFVATETRIIVGGRAANAYTEVLGQISAKRVSDLTEFCQTLNAWNSTVRPQSG